MSPPDEPSAALPPHDRVRVMVVTGSRADYGLLRPVMRAIAAHPRLELVTVAAGSHLIPPAETYREVKRDFAVGDAVPMQRAGPATRHDDAEAVGRGVMLFTRVLLRHRPRWVVVLGDRIEAFAAAASASVAGVPVAHLHGGDRAEGIADEAMRHAITKLAHLHLPATEQSAQRILRMGERPEHVFVVGSPAMDELASIPAASDELMHRHGDPEAVFLLHPIGRDAEQEEAVASASLAALRGVRVLALHPNHDPGRGGIVRAIREAGVPTAEHLPRGDFIGVLRRVGLLVGNSSAGLIEAAALGCRVVNIGARQAGRERPEHVIDARAETIGAIAEAIHKARELPDGPYRHPYGDGRAGARAADVIAGTDPNDPRLVRKRCAY